MTSNYDVVRVEFVPVYRLLVRFRNGTAGTVELAESFFRGVFEDLRGPGRLAEAHCRNGFVEWPGELDLAPDAIRRSGHWRLD